MTKSFSISMIHRRLSIVGTFSALTLCTTVVSGQTPAAKFVDSARVELEQADRMRDIPRVARAVILLDRAAAAFPGDPYVLHYRGYAAYLRAVSMFAANDVHSAAPLLNAAAADLSRSGEKLAWPETFALLASVSGLMIAVDQSRAMELGQQIGELQGRAMQLGPRNPRVALILGEGLANTPEEWGGGVEKARQMLARAVALFASDAPPPLAPRWGREEAEAQLKALGVKSP